MHLAQCQRFNESMTELKGMHRFSFFIFDICCDFYFDPSILAARLEIGLEHLRCRLIELRVKSTTFEYHKKMCKKTCDNSHA